MYSLPRLEEVFSDGIDFDNLKSDEIEGICQDKFIDLYCKKGKIRYIKDFIKMYFLNFDLFKYEMPDNINFSQEQQYNNLRFQLLYAMRDNVINNSHLEGKILDFGCGEGGSSILLSNKSENVIAIDKREEPLRKLAKVKTNNSGKIWLGCGLTYMEKQIEENSLDMVVAMYLGFYDTPKWFVKTFCDLSMSRLKEGGALLISSDLFTMEKVEEHLGISRKNYHPRYLFVNN